jgi:hypothetical protein
LYPSYTIVLCGKSVQALAIPIATTIVSTASMQISESRNTFLKCQTSLLTKSYTAYATMPATENNKIHTKHFALAKRQILKNILLKVVLK